jgi:hypothetical protein
MRAAILQGPISRSALVVCPTQLSENRTARLRARRQIGLGTRAIIETDPALVKRRRHAPKPRPQARPMKRTTLVATLAGALLVSATAFGISAAVDSPRSLMSPTDYSVMKKSIESDTRLALGKCRDQESQGRDVCKAEARADERVKKADLEAQYRGTVAAAADARLARAKASYDIAKARCGDQRGEDKLSCLRSARSEKAKALEAAQKLAST